MLQQPDASPVPIVGRALALLAAAAVLAKLPTLGTPAFWDEMAYVSQAAWLADNGLLKAIPGLRPDALFFGHPPGLHFAGAALFKVFGHSIVVAHVLIACIGAIGVGATFVMLRAHHDEKTSWLAALLLLLSPAWFSSAGMFLADLPVAALGVSCAVLVMQSRLAAYILLASCMVLIKETAVSLVVALATFRLLTRGPVTRQTLMDAIPWLAPLLVFAAFVVVQKVATGRFFYIYDFETEPLFDLGITSTLRQAAQISHWIFIAQFRWVMTAAIALDLVSNREARHRPELLLCALVTVMAGYAFAVLFYMPRYLLPVLPFFYGLGAISLMSLARTNVRQQVAGVAVIGLTLWSLVRDPYRGHGEDNMRYVGIARMHRAVALELESRYADARVVSAWPVATQLAHPLLGYVSAPVRLKWYAGPADLSEADIAVVPQPGNAGADSLRALVERLDWRAASRRQSDEHVVTIYERRTSTDR